MALIGVAGGFLSPATPTHPGGAVKLKRYDVIIGGNSTTLQLSDEDARARGILVAAPAPAPAPAPALEPAEVPTKARKPANKGRRTNNKRATADRYYYGGPQPDAEKPDGE